MIGRVEHLEQVWHLRAATELMLAYIYFRAEKAHSAPDNALDGQVKDVRARLVANVQQVLEA